MGKVNYLVDLHDPRKSKRVIHVNMLKEWRILTSTKYVANEVDNDDLEETEERKEAKLKLESS